MRGINRTFAHYLPTEREYERLWELINVNKCLKEDLLRAKYEITLSNMPCPKDSITDETRKRMREAAIKRMADPEIRKKISEANVGKKRSPETIAKRVEKLKGLKHPSRSEDSLKKYRESSKKKWEDPEYRKYMSEVHKGKKQSKETIERRVAKITG